MIIRRAKIFNLGLRLGLRASTGSRHSDPQTRPAPQDNTHKRHNYEVIMD
jgi:hypothetical protein